MMDQEQNRIKDIHATTHIENVNERTRRSILASNLMDQEQNRIKKEESCVGNI